MKAVVDEGTWLATESPATETELEERHRRAIEDGNPVFVLEDEAEIVGALGMQPAGATGVLSLGMWILASRRGRGGGRMLMDAALAARPADVHKIELEVWPDNEAAIGLYRGMGFEREGLRRNHYRRQDGSLRSALIMARLFE
jgi:ribosomal protein S18 acetylase RimI-like enzyme